MQLAVSWYCAGTWQFQLALVVAGAGGAGWDRLLKEAGGTATGTAAQQWPQRAPLVAISRLILEFGRSVFQSVLYDTCRTYLSFWHQLLNGVPSSELGRNALALTKLLGLGVALKGDGESSRTRCVWTPTAESETYKYTHYYQIW